MLVRCLFQKISTSKFYRHGVSISKKKRTAKKCSGRYRQVADAEHGSALLNMEFNGSAESWQKAPLDAVFSKLVHDSKPWSSTTLSHCVYIKSGICRVTGVSTHTTTEAIVWTTRGWRCLMCRTQVRLIPTTVTTYYVWLCCMLQ